MSMNVYASYGDFVVFANPTAGLSGHQKRAALHLKVGAVYIIEKTDVGNYHTDVYLIEFPGISFNSILFNDYSKGTYK